MNAIEKKYRMKQMSNPVYPKNENNWWNEKDFNLYIDYEKSRAERVGYTICYVMINFFDPTKYKSTLNRKGLNYLIRFLVIKINQCLHKTEIRCLFNSTKIGFVLLDTSLQDARNVMDEIFQRVFVKLSSSQLEHAIEYIKSIEISSYPIHKISSCNHLNGKPVFIKSSLKPVKNEAEKPLCGKKSQFDIEWKKINCTELKEPLKTDLLSRHTTASINFVYKYLKRVVDILGSIFLIIMSSPLMLMIAILVKLTSKGPVFYTQKRVGYMGKEFSFLKFRSMRVGNDDRIHQEYVKKLIKGKIDQTTSGEDEKPVYKLQNDPRITSIGKILRPSSLDELPQFFNVLRGDMSLVGPRPPLPYEVTEYDKWHYRRIFEIKPGITGLWQVSDRNRLTFDEMVRLDINYTEKWNLLLDFKILISTFKAVLASEGY